MNRKNRLLMAAFSLIMSAIWAQAVPLPIYSVKDIGFLPGFTQMTGAINIKGDIVGTAYTGLQQYGGYIFPGRHGFLYHGGKLTDLGAGEAIAINASTEVLGNTFDPSSQMYTVFLYMNGKFTRLPNTYATDLNDLGQVLIYSDIGVAQIRQPNGVIVSYPIGDPNINLFGAWALNDLGQVIDRDFVYPHGSNDLDFLNNVILVQPGGSYRIITNGGLDNYCFPVAMNILGQAVGHNYNLYWDNYYQNAFYDNGHAIPYNPDGQAVVLGNLFPGTTPEGRRPVPTLTELTPSEQSSALVDRCLMVMSEASST
jgi:hypothetical protein